MNKKVLIVEDDKLLSEVYLKSMKSEGINATVCNGYKQAVDFIKYKKAYIIILDVILDIKNGFELLKDIRKLPNGSAAKTIILTGMNTDEITIDSDLTISLNIIGVYTKSQISIKSLCDLLKKELDKIE